MKKFLIIAGGLLASCTLPEIDLHDCLNLCNTHLIECAEGAQLQENKKERDWETFGCLFDAVECYEGCVEDAEDELEDF